MNKAQFNDKINELWTKTKSGQLPRKQRFIEIERLIDNYIMWNGKRPDAQALDRLATLCLYEEVTDSRPDKMTLEEYPVLSDNQYERRTEGKHVKRHDNNGNIMPNKTEIPLNAAYDRGMDGRDYRTPKKRKLSTDEAIKSDEKRSRNKERQRRYKYFIKPGKVEVSYIDD